LNLAHHKRLHQFGDHDLHLRWENPDGAAPVRLVLSGELDAAEIDKLGKAVTAALGSGPAVDLHLDAAELFFLDSGGIRGLLLARKQVRQAGGRLSIVAVSPIVRQVLEITGLLEIFGIEEQPDAAGASAVEARSDRREARPESVR
jgi:anti-anti-sigma factor